MIRYLHLWYIWYLHLWYIWYFIYCVFFSSKNDVITGWNGMVSLTLLRMTLNAVQRVDSLACSWMRMICRQNRSLDTFVHGVLTASSDVFEKVWTMLSFCGCVVVEHVVRNVSKCCHVNCLHTLFWLFACWVIFHDFIFCLQSFFKKFTFSMNSFRNNIGVKQFGFRSDPTLCRAWSGSKLSAKVISRRH